VTHGIPDREGKHAAKFIKALFAPVGVRFQDHFRVGKAAEVHALPLQLRANLAKVINLTVVDDPVAGCGIVHGLVPVGRQVENCEAAIA
jgi:hypothetical protein